MRRSLIAYLVYGTTLLSLHGVGAFRGWWRMKMNWSSGSSGGGHGGSGWGGGSGGGGFRGGK